MKFLNKKSNIKSLVYILVGSVLLISACSNSKKAEIANPIAEPAYAKDESVLFLDIEKISLAIEETKYGKNYNTASLELARRVHNNSSQFRWNFYPKLVDDVGYNTPEFDFIRKNGRNYLAAHNLKLNGEKPKIPEFYLNQLYLNDFLTEFLKYQVKPVRWAQNKDSVSTNATKSHGKQLSRYEWAEALLATNGTVPQMSAPSFALSASGLKVHDNISAQEFQELLNSRYQRVDEPNTGDIVIGSTAFNANPICYERLQSTPAVFLGYTNHKNPIKLVLTKSMRGDRNAEIVDFHGYKMMNLPVCDHEPKNISFSYWRLKENL